MTADPTRSNQQPLHRVDLVRDRQGVSIRSASRHLNLEQSTVREQLNELHNMTLSQLYEWQTLLKVPLIELLVDKDDELSDPLKMRAELVKLMKTATTISKHARDAPTQRLVQLLIEQLVEIAPELKDVGPWASERDTPTIASRRILNGRVPDDLFTAEPGGMELDD